LTQPGSCHNVATVQLLQKQFPAALARNWISGFGVLRDHPGRAWIYRDAGLSE
jgi:hypothetical protein